MRSSLPFCHTDSSCFASCCCRCCCRNAGQDQWPHINLPVSEDQINVFSSSGKINSRGFQSSKYQVPRSINIIFMCVYASLIYGQIITQCLIRVLKIAADRCRSLKIAVDRCRSECDSSRLEYAFARPIAGSFVSKYLVSFPLYMRAKELPR